MSHCFASALYVATSRWNGPVPEVAAAATGCHRCRCWWRRRRAWVRVSGSLDCSTSSAWWSRPYRGKDRLLDRCGECVGREHVVDETAAGGCLLRVAEGPPVRVLAVRGVLDVGESGVLHAGVGGRGDVVVAGDRTSPTRRPAACRGGEGGVHLSLGGGNSPRVARVGLASGLDGRQQMVVDDREVGARCCGLELCPLQRLGPERLRRRHRRIRLRP